MKLGELQDAIDFAILTKQRNQMYSGNLRDKNVVIITSESFVKGNPFKSPFSEISNANFGIDWDAGQFIIKPSEPLVKKSTLDNVLKQLEYYKKELEKYEHE